MEDEDVDDPGEVSEVQNPKRIPLPTVQNAPQNRGYRPPKITSRTNRSHLARKDLGSCKTYVNNAIIR